MFSSIGQWFSPDPDPDLESAFEFHRAHLPTVWLLGKTGAGKSSLIQAVTGDEKVKIGNGFAPCTQTAEIYEFPQEKPLFRFLDTRGLGEAGYDPSEDLAMAKAQSHALIVVARVDDPSQGSLAKVVEAIRKQGGVEAPLVVHTGVETLVSSEERVQAIAHNQTQFEEAWGEALESVEVDFEGTSGNPVNVEQLKKTLVERLPVVAITLHEQVASDLEEQNFLRLRTEVLWYAGAAGASDAIPAVGLVSVPAIQGKMIHSMACQYGVEWDRQTLSEFIAALGTGFGIQYLSRLGIRQLVKLVPVYGQTVGSASAAALSFASTYAIGRAAAYYLFHKGRDETVPEKIRVLYQDALKQIWEIARNETAQ